MYVFDVRSRSFFRILKVFLLNINIKNLAVNIFSIVLPHLLFRITESDLSYKSFFFTDSFFMIWRAIVNKIINLTFNLWMFFLRDWFYVLYAAQTTSILHLLNIIFDFFHL